MMMTIDTGHHVRQGSPSGRERGFTLIELMLVIAIIGILAAIAVPNYQEYNTKSRRSDGTSMLMQIAAKQEQYFMDNRAYTSDLTNLGYATSPAISENGYYSISANVPNDYEFTLTATPQGPQAGDGTCATLTLDQNGTKGAEDSSTNDTTEACW